MDNCELYGVHLSRGGMVIQTPANDLQDRAMALQKKWLAPGGNTHDNKMRYAQALLDWAREIDNKHAIDHALYLIANLV